MGIIRRQSIKVTIISFISAFIGAINMLLIYEILLDPDQLGKIKYLTATAFLLVPFVMLGVTTTMLRFFPRFENKDTGHHGVLGFGFLYTCTGFILYIILTLLFFDALPAKFQDNYWIITGILLAAIFMILLSTYLASLKEIVIRTIFNNFWIKIGVPLLVVLYHYDLISFQNLEWNLITVYFIAVVGLLIYIRSLGQLFLRPDFSFPDKELVSEIKTYALYSTLGPMGAVLMTQLDQFMVAEILEFQDNGVYAMAISFGSLFTIPTTSIFSIANPIISESSDKGDRDNIYSIYRKSSINLLVIGLLGLILIWINIDDIYSLMSKGDIYAQGKYVVLFLSIGKVIDMATSVNGAIIAHSKYFRFNLYSLLLLGLLNIVSNYFFIKSYGITGAAIATFSALSLFNLVKLFYVQYRFKMQPFTIQTVKVIIIAVIVYGLTTVLDFTTGITIADIILKSGIVTLVFGIFILVFRISEDINSVVSGVLNRIRS